MSTSTRPPAPTETRFAADRPTDLREPPPWHRLAYIARLLPRRLQALAGDLRVPPAGRVLDFGCADMPYRRFFGPDVQFVGADLPGNELAALTIAADGTVPAEEGSFDAVLSTQVLEHVADPAVHLAECARLLRPRGRLLLSTHGIMAFHPDPVDYWRWTCAGLRRAVEDTGLRVVRFEGIMGLAASGLQLFQDGVAQRLPRLLHPAFFLVMQAAIAAADALQRGDGRQLNALVFALVAEKP